MAFASFTSIIQVSSSLPLSAYCTAYAPTGPLVNGYFTGRSIYLELGSPRSPARAQFTALICSHSGDRDLQRRRYTSHARTVLDLPPFAARAGAHALAASSSSAQSFILTRVSSTAWRIERSRTGQTHGPIRRIRASLLRLWCAQLLIRQPSSYTVTTAGQEGFLSLLPVYLDHILYPCALLMFARKSC